MKKRVKSLVMLLASVVGIGAMAGACDQLKKPSHEHTYADAWSSDAAGHWHEATCDCEDLVPEKTAHTDANNDAVCDVCEFTNHEHTYAEDWSSDANKHWHAADCGHNVANKDEAAHADADEDGKCDVCDYVVGEIHEHTYSTEWSFDEEYHWHEANCGHDVEIKDKQAHNLNEAGDCTICEQHIQDIDTLDIESVLAAAIANENKIKSGVVTAMDVVYGGTGTERVESAKANIVTFELGNGTSYIKWETYDKENTLVGTDEQWHQALSAEEFFGVELKSGAEKITPIASDAQFLKGYTYFPGSILGADSDDTSTLANTFMGLYNKMKAGVRVSNTLEGYDKETGKYAFTYTYYSVNPHTRAGAVWNVELEYYNVTVTFSVNSDMIIDAADFVVEVYRDYENDSDLSYTYVDNGDGTVTINDLQLKETANPSLYVYKVTQESGDRTFVNPYLKENVIPTSFELTHVTKTSWDENSQLVIDEEVAIGESLEILTGTYTRFHIGSFLPETADPAFLNSSDVSYSFVNKDASSTAQCWYASDSIVNGYSAYSQTIALKIRDVGEYTVTIQLGELTKVFDIVVKAEEAPDLGEDDANTVNVQTTDTNCYKDLYSYTATEAGTYTFSLPAGLGLYSKAAYDSWGAPECDVLDPSVDSTVAHSVAVQLAAGETFEFYVGATTKASWVITVSFEAGEVGGGDEEENQYDYATVITVDNGSVWFSATEISANEATRTLTIAEDGSYKVSNSNLFISSITDANNTPIAADMQVYVLTAGDYTVSFGMFSMLSVKADTEYVISVVKQATEDTDPPAEDTTDISGTYIASATNQDDATLTIDATAGTIVFEFGTNTVNYTYEIVDGTVNLYKDGSLISGSMAMYMGVLNLDADGKPSTFQYNGYTYTLTKSEGSEEGGDTPVDPEPEVIEPVGYLYEGEETMVNVTDADIEAGKIYYSFYAYETGDYQFTSNWFAVTVLDADGNALTPVSYGVYALESWTEYLVEIGTSWVSSAGEYGVTVEYQAPAGHQDNPIAIEAGDYTAAYVGNSYAPVWHKYVATANGTVTVSSTNADADLLITTVYGNEVQSENATVSLQVRAGYTYYIGVADFEATADVTIAFTVALVEGEVTADGTVNVPYEIVDGENTATIAQYGSAWFAYKATAAGSLTLTTESTNAAWDIQAPIHVTADEENKIYVEMAEGDVIYLSIGTLNWEADTIVFTATWKGEPESVFTQLVVGDNTLEIADNTWLTSDVYNLSGNYTVTWTGDVIVEVDGVAMENGGTFNSMNPMWSVYFRIYAENYAAVPAFTLTITAQVVPATELILGDNTVTVTDTYAGTTVEYTAAEAGTYTFTAGTNAVLGYDYSNYLAGESFSVELAAGEVVSFVVLTEDYSEGDVVVTVSGVAGGEEPEPEVPAGPAGTSSDPYIITELPFTVTFESTHDKYYTYTATEDCTLYITCPDGCLVSEIGATKDADGNYTVAVTAGQVLKINPWSNGGTAPYTYTISVLVEEEPAPDQGGEEGGETPDVGGVDLSNAKAVQISSVNNGTTYYLTTTISGGMITASTTEAGAWYIEETDGGFYLFYVENGEKMYLYMTSGSSNDAFAVTSTIDNAHVWYWDVESSMILNTTFAGRYIGYHGSRGAFRTINSENTYGNPAASYVEI